MAGDKVESEVAQGIGCGMIGYLVKQVMQLFFLIMVTVPPHKTAIRNWMD